MMLSNLFFTQSGSDNSIQVEIGGDYDEAWEMFKKSEDSKLNATTTPSSSSSAVTTSTTSNTASSLYSVHALNVLLEFTLSDRKSMIACTFVF
jgi:hypothetical protein